MLLRQWGRFAGVVGCSLATALASLALAASAQASTGTDTGAPTNVLGTNGPTEGPLTAAQLAAYLRAAALITQAPADLTPALDDTEAWGPIIVRNGCQLSLIVKVRSKPCVYGDTTAQTTVALFGDSHAGAWFPALEQISLQLHWRLLIFTKAGCSPPEVRLYRKCDKWRRNTEAQIASIHPAIVIVSWARWIEPKARAERGVPTGYGGAWLNGMAAIFQFLQQSAGRVIFISDVPTLNFGAVACVSHHLTDVQSCNNTPRSRAIFLPKLRTAEFQLARRMHIPTIDPIPWFCTPLVCPVVVRNTLVYYDSSHMTPAWSTFIAPVLSASLTSILGTSPRAGAHR